MAGADYTIGPVTVQRTGARLRSLTLYDKTLRLSPAETVQPARGTPEEVR